VVRGDYPQVHVEDLPGLLQPPNGPPAFLLDVRTPEEFTGGSISGSVNVPLDDLRAHLAELPDNRPIVVTCAAGQRGYLATRVLRHAGLDACNLSGGYRTYKMHGSPPIRTE
jgi:rhodanese-related sulfurtransferase